MLHIVSYSFYDYRHRDYCLFIEFFYESLDKEHGYHYRELDSHYDMIKMFRDEIDSCQSLPEVERCCNAFLNAISHVCRHARAHRVLDEAKRLKDEWEHVFGIKLTDID